MRTNSNFLFVIMGFLMAIAVVIAIAFAIYKSLYTRRINKRLAEGRGAKIKPIMSPVKFVIVTLASAIGIILVLWVVLILFFSAKMNISRMDMISEPHIRLMNSDLIKNSVIGEYRSGDEIKGYTKHTFNDKDTCIEVYTLDEEYTNVFAPVLVTAEYTGSKSVTFSAIEINFEGNNFSVDWDGMNENALIAIDTGGYKGDFDIEYNLFFDKNTGDTGERYVDFETGVTLSVNEYSQVKIIE
ncbi:MAG: hypothetical protein K5898_16325 [Ruminococcus sp.]|uniref:hypothetical protein n=1 Tax=Ruminococcus sp. TaxID=41978 RepID=UPI0025E16CDB|nr:hypothetical protein [Ruminococcus sp.]MCR4796707.1 hypothetical protein [Ruminococcus sp.]